MRTNLLEAKTITYRDIIGNGKKYIIPLYQRNYSWREEHWEELWLDIKRIVKTENKEIHYMGSIVIQPSDEDKTFIVIDGQQRLVTISILILACLQIVRGFNTEDDKEREKIIRDTFLGNKDGISLSYSSKIKLNRINNDFYQTYLIQLRDPMNRSKLNDSDRLMSDAYMYFLSSIKQESFSKSGADLYRFIDTTIGDRLFFIQISVDDDVSAYTVFETLNARGLELTSTDLLKNYLFSLIKSDVDIQAIDMRWREISETVGLRKLPQFLRYYLNSKQKLIRMERLLKEIKNSIRNDVDVFKLLDDLVKYADIFVAFDDPDNELWKKDKSIPTLMEELSMYNVEQHKSLLMTAYFKLELPEFVKTLRIIRAIVFRYTVIASLNPNELENCYNKAAIKIDKKEMTKASEIFKELLPIYPSDEKFKDSFSTKSFVTKNTKQRKLIKYIFASLENQQHNKDVFVFDVDATIEHILPENPNEIWFNDIAREDHESMVYRLGNLSLLEEKKNKECANKSFVDKKNLYETSQYAITRSICTKDTWSDEEIRNRQKQLANIAVAVWKAEY